MSSKVWSRSAAPKSTTVPNASTACQQKSYSCVLCAQRKVRCDKRSSGCVNCAKACVPCIYKAPAPPRRRKKGAQDIDIHAKLRLYENTLRELGVEPADLVSKSHVSASRIHDLNETPDAEERESAMSAGPKKPLQGSDTKDAGVLISGDGKSRYLENGLWTSLKGEFRDSTDLLNESSDEESVAYGDFTPPPESFLPDGGSLMFGSTKPAATLRPLHPQPVQIFKLWQTYLSNINPIVKVFHTPTIQQILLEASGNLDDIPSNVEALLFAIYCISLSSLDETECSTIMGQPKAFSMQRFRSGAQHALINAGFLKTSDLMVLQAFVLFLISLQNFDARVTWIFTGVAARIGQRIGLHRDGEMLNLPPFEIEMRRRLWWQILLLEGSVEKLAGTGGNIFMGDTKPPSNLNDSDLFQGMKEMPKEHEGATEMMFFKMRTHVGEFLKRMANTKSNFDGVWSTLSTTSVPLSVKDKAIDDLDALFQTKYLQYCDRSIPWHFMCIHLAKAVIFMTRFIAHSSELHTNPSPNASQSDSDMLFDISLQVVSLLNLAYSTKEMQGYLWQLNLNFQWKAFIYVVSELQYRTQSSDVDVAWKQVEMVYKYHPDLAKVANKRALPVAIGNLTLKAWEAFLSMRGVPECGEPYFIQMLRNQRVGTKSSKDASMAPGVPLIPAPTSADDYLNFGMGNMVQTTDPLESLQWTSDFAATLDSVPILPELPMLDPETLNWSAWDNLVVDFQVNEFPMDGQEFGFGI
ncbi:hypothetical protein K504DRAFT_391558 [Pleomassaria siparia CBS 279.74]|uniref:Zn(2)-C6 fungal-type domain-containing protein n=1 Tax=Pleomassaria siparia CBS 279.74 TaxID=1314801 RepID=A0A6G1JU31_9PLEO|nr:hypothetical protein K504DRAFT_391558 [Pleomassaria siparia CBS 279.74]